MWRTKEGRLIMDNLEFAKAMIRYEELYTEMKKLEAVITDHVMDKGETQAIGNVYAKYSNGRTEYDYSAIREAYPPEDLADIIYDNTKVIEKIDWRSICLAMDWKAPVSKEPVPYVKIEVKD
jgi:hypothetical protein